MSSVSHHGHCTRSVPYRAVLVCHHTCMLRWRRHASLTQVLFKKLTTDLLLTAQHIHVPWRLSLLVSFRAAQAPTPAAAAEQPKAVLSLEEVRAHLAQHSVIHRQQQQHKQQAGTAADCAQQQGPSSSSAGAAAAAAAAAGDGMDCDAGPDELALAGEVDDSDDLDDFIVQPAAQQQQGESAAAGVGSCRLKTQAGVE